MKHNKKQCRKCIYRGNMQGPSLLFCNYAAITDRTCLRRVGKEVIDIRGEDYDQCELFEEGKNRSMTDYHQLTIEEYTTNRHIDFSCFASYVTYPGAGCRSGECPHQENTDCRSCEAFRVFYETVEKYRNGERRLAECHFLAHKELGIPTAYDENGRIKNEN